MQGTQLNTIGSGKLDHCYASCIGVVDDLRGDGVFKGHDLYKWGEVPHDGCVETHLFRLCVYVCNCVWVYMCYVCLYMCM